MANTQNFDLPHDAYLGFDAQNVKELIIQRLEQGGVYTDHEYEGSNMSALIDVIAYVYHLLLFYLNRVGTESTFTQTQLYENMNKIVKLLGYSPIGYQTPCVSFDVSARVSKGNLDKDTVYTIPRFAYINVNGIKYTFTKDVSFSLNDANKNGDVYNLTEFSNSNILFQGDIIEATEYIPRGDKFETYILTPNNNSITEQTTYVDFANFSIFVWSREYGWQEWTETSSLYLENSSSLKYEKRLNESGYYEFRFGDGIHGKLLSPDNVVQIYYLQSSGTSGEIGSNQLKNNTLNLYSTINYNSITNQLLTNVIGIEGAKLLSFNNTTQSTKFTLPETVDEIRANHGKVFKSQSQLITARDIQTHIERYFNNITSSVYVCNNQDYINTVLSYYNSLGINSINKESRISYNQVNFSSSCNFNNIYAYMVPKFTPVTDDNIGQYIDLNLKQYIVEQLDSRKPLTTEIIPSDPIYIAVGFGVSDVTDTITSPYMHSKQTPDDIINATKLTVVRYYNSHNKISLIKSQIIDIINEIFDNASLGYTISPTNIANSILSIEGVKTIYTARGDNITNGVSLMLWNPQHYNKDLRITTDDIIFDNFKYPFFYNKKQLADYIDVIVEE